jgi:hypothetical protein
MFPKAARVPNSGGFRPPVGAALCCQKLLAWASSCLQISAAAAEFDSNCSIFSIMRNGQVYYPTLVNCKFID